MTTGVRILPVRRVYHRPTDTFCGLVGVDSKSRATIDHPAKGRIVVPCTELTEAHR